MKLFSQSHSPFARKVVVLIHELGLDGIQIEHQETSPTNPNHTVRSANPLAKVPVLITPEHGPVYDSAVICEYLCNKAGDTSILPSSDELRFPALRQQALGAGLCEVGIAVRWETERRPEGLRYPKLRDGLIDKLVASYEDLEENPPEPGVVTIGTIALACAADWLAFRGLDTYAVPGARFANWLSGFTARDSMQATRYEGATFD